MAQNSLMYGTAWKKENTTKLVLQALKAGFRSIDVAAQPRHYREDLVGEALRQAYSEGIVKREDLFIQTKFTSLSGQDPDNLPYDPKSPLGSQVLTSIASSLTNLSSTSTPNDTTYIDSLVLHSPLRTLPQTLLVWKTLQAMVPTKLRALGIANTDLSTLKALYDSEEVEVKPSFVQNRFYEDTGYDVELRAFCREKGIVYQSFWTLTANPALMRSDVVGTVAAKCEVEKAVALYALILSLAPAGQITILNGTTRSERMAADLAGIELIQQWGMENAGEWKDVVGKFRGLIGED